MQLDLSKCKTLGDTPRLPLIPNVTFATHFSELKFQEDSEMAGTCVCPSSMHWFLQKSAHQVMTSVTLTFDLERSKTIQHFFNVIYTSVPSLVVI